MYRVCLETLAAAQVTNVYKLSTCLLANIKATRHGLGSSAVSFG